MLQTTSKLSRLALNDEGFAFDPATGDAYLLNRSGLEVVRAIHGGRAEPEIAQTLADRHGLRVETAARDVGDFLGVLKSLKLI